MGSYYPSNAEATSVQNTIIIDTWYSALSTYNVQKRFNRF